MRSGVYAITRDFRRRICDKSDNSEGVYAIRRDLEAYMRSGVYAVWKSGYIHWLFSQNGSTIHSIEFDVVQSDSIDRSGAVVENWPDFYPAKLLWPYKASRVPFRLQKALWESYLANQTIES